MTEIRHGYTLHDIDRCARIACSADRSLSSDAVTRYSVAWSAIAERLCTSTETPEWTSLVRVGWQAIYREVREMRHTFGQVRGDRVRPDALSSLMPRAVQYWFVPTPDPHDGLVERVALAQIWAILRPVERQALVALAVHDDYQVAAEMLGLSYKGFCKRVANARRAFRHSWFAPDRAPVHRLDRRASSRRSLESPVHEEVSA